MENFSLSLYGSTLLFFLIFIFLGWLSYFVYKRTNPPAPTWLKTILTVLRFLSLAIILFILFEPILKLSWQRKEKPIVAVLLDNSASMTLENNGESRAQKAISVLGSEIFQNGVKDVNFDYYQFSYKLDPFKIDELDSVKFLADGTDLSTSLKQLQEQNINNYLSAIILLSDGINNLGENPIRTAEDLNLPIYPISVGEMRDQKDIVISKITTNQLAYANSEVPVDVTIKSTGYNGKKIKVDLIEGTNVLDSKYIDLADNLESQIRLKFIPQEIGKQIYTIEIPVLENELTPLNNRKNFYVKVLKSRIKILYLSGGPGADFSFIKRTLDADPNIETDYWVAKKNQGFYQGNFSNDLSKLKNYDCVILQNYPPKNHKNKVIPLLKRLFDSEATPLFFIAGNNNDFQKLSQLKNFTPFAFPIRDYPEFETTPGLSPIGLSHPVTRIDDDELNNQTLWQEVPPIFYSLNNVQLYPGSEILLAAEPVQRNVRLQNRVLPLIISRKIANSKSMAILGYEIWRWDLLMWGVGKTDQLFTQLLSNSIRWLINKEDNKTVRLKPDQEIYRNGQKISFSCQVYNENYLPLNGAEVRVQIFNDKNNYEILLSSIGDGKYEGELQALEGGDYKYEGTARYKNILMGSDNGQFSVENLNLEHLQTKIENDFLKQLALKTGGQFINDSNFVSLEEALKFPVKTRIESREWQLWNKLVLLILVILLLSVEWFLRKRSGML
ncbi:hypothetical protein ISS22_02240 [candidate division KSB1 bacterium]|nr:hypothetical protein [candidate division KSB1 bacterium]